MLTYLDAEAPLRDDEVTWALEHNPIFIAALPGGRYGGIVVTPARTVLGLRGWEDAHEGLTDDDTPWVLFDLEKLIRMMLRQSGLAFELLTASTTWPGGGIEARRIAEAAVTRGIAGYYGDVARPLVAGDDAEPWRWRSLLTGWLLTTRGEISYELDTLQEAAGCDDPSVPECQRLVNEMRAGDALGDSPSDYDGLNDLLVDARLEAR